MKARLKKILAKIGFAYCPKCGSDLWFDEERWNLGYNVHSVCLKCKEGK